MKSPPGVERERGLVNEQQESGHICKVTLLVVVLLLLATTPTRGAGTAKTRPAVGHSAYAEGPPCYWSARDSTTGKKRRHDVTSSAFPHLSLDGTLHLTTGISPLHPFPCPTQIDRDTPSPTSPPNEVSRSWCRGNGSQVMKYFY